MAGRTREQMQERSDERKALALTVLPGGAAELEQDRRGVLAKADVLGELFELFKPDIAEQAPGLVDPDSFLRTVLTGMRTSKQAVQLVLSSRPSLLSALLEAARLGLTPFTDEGAIVPFWSKAERQYVATFIPGYKGYIQLFYRTGQVAGVAANLIYQKDAWELSYGDDGRFRHEPALVDRETGETIGRGVEGNIAILSYCYVTFRGGGRTEVTTVTRGQACEIRDEYSESYKQAEKRWADSGGKYGKDSFWHTDFDLAMRKTAVRRHAGVAPMSPELRMLAAIDQRDDTRPDVRARAAEAPAVPLRKGIDWDKTVGGADPGDVPGPDGADGEGEGGQDDGGGAGQRRERVTVTRSRAPAPQPDGGALVSARTRALLRGRFSRAGLAGDNDAEFRLVVTGVLVAGRYRRLDDDGQLTQAEAEYAISQFDKLAEKAGRAGQDLGEALRGVYDRAAAERDAAAGQPAAGTSEGVVVEDLPGDLPGAPG